MTLGMYPSEKSERELTAGYLGPKCVKAWSDREGE